MSNDQYGDLGRQMKQMKDQRARCMASIRHDRGQRSGQVENILNQGRRIVAQASSLLQKTGRANAQLQAQTRRALADARSELNGVAQQTRAANQRTRTHVHQEVSAVKADAERIVADAGALLADTRRGNEHLRSAARQIVADAAATIARFAAASRQRAADWQAIIRSVRGTEAAPGAASGPAQTRRRSKQARTN